MHCCPGSYFLINTDHNAIWTSEYSLYSANDNTLIFWYYAKFYIEIVWAMRLSEYLIYSEIIAPIFQVFFPKLHYIFAFPKAKCTICFLIMSKFHFYWKIKRVRFVDETWLYWSSSVIQKYFWNLVFKIFILCNLKQ